MRRYVVAVVTLLMLVSLYLVHAAVGWVGMLIVSAFTFRSLGRKHASRRIEMSSSLT
jgi:hypothetical protein